MLLFFSNLAATGNYVCNSNVNTVPLLFKDMVVSGVPRENGILHAGEIASMALDLVAVCKTFKIPHKPNTLLKIRAGIHSGMLRGL